MEKRKNVIYIVCDQLRAQSLGCYGDINASTPNIDLLAEEGVLFENSVASTPLCTPARGNMLTGQYVFNHSASGHDYHLDNKYPYLSDYYNQKSYKTMYFGKWHLDGSHVPITNEATSLIVPKKNRGNFDVWLGYENNNSQNHFFIHGHDEKSEVKSYLVNEYETDYITDLSLSYIEKYKDEDIFVWMNFQPPHDPYIAPPNYMEKFKSQDIKLRPNVPLGGKYEKQARKDLAGYNAMIKCIDDNVGKLVIKLKKLGIYKDTHIVLTSDHGDMHGSHGQYRKTTYWEEAIKVPFIIGGAIPFNYEGMKNKNVEAIIDQYDIAPTLLGLANIEKPIDMPGIDYSYTRYIDKNGPKKNCTVFGNYIPTGHNDSIKDQFRGVLSTNGIKYIVGEAGEIGLYDLKTDAFEQANLIHNPEYFELLKTQRKLLSSMLEEMNDPFLGLEVVKRLKK